MSEGERLSEIARRAEKATPGPWRWFGNVDNQSLHLATAHSGRRIVMDFVRWGMNRAQPRWNVTPPGQAWGYMEKTKDLPVFEVNRAATARDDPTVYRGDIVAIRHPDAEFIANARADVDWLIHRVQQLESELDAAHLHSIEVSNPGIDVEEVKRVRAAAR